VADQWYLPFRSFRQTIIRHFTQPKSLTLVEIESTDTAPFLIVGDTMSTRRDLYKDGVDFTTLALQSLDFAK
jgi:hypothetical protein